MAQTSRVDIRCAAAAPAHSTIELNVGSRRRQDQTVGAAVTREHAVGASRPGRVRLELPTTGGEFGEIEEHRGKRSRPVRG